MRAASLALLSACASSGPATFEIGVRMSRLGPDDLALDLVDLSLELAALRLRSCPDTPNERAYIRGFNASERPRVLLPAAGPVNLPIGGRLLATRDRGFDVIVGPWCEVDVVLDGPLCVVADAPDTGARLELALRLPDLTFPDVDRVGRVEEVQDAGTRKAEKVIAPATLELAAGPWLDAVLPDLLAGQDVRVEPPADGGDGALHDALVARLLAGQGPALYRTASADAGLTDEELAAAPLGVGAPAETTASLGADPCGFD